jgi:hypothetical protein
MLQSVMDKKRSSLVLAAVCLAACGPSEPPTLRATSATELGTVPQSSKIQGHDGAASGLAFGHSVWLYGDTFLNDADAEGETLHSNSFAYTDDLDASDGIDGFVERLDSAGAPTPLVPDTADEATFDQQHYGDPCMVTPCGARWAKWPGAPLFDAANDRALIPYSLIYAQPGNFNFHGVGASIAVWTDFASAATRPTLSSDPTYPTMIFSQEEPGYDESLVIDGDDLYAFACDTSGGGSPCTVARAPLADVLTRSAYTFWDGSTWSPTIGNARPIFDGGQGVNVFRLGAQWVAVYTDNLTSDVVLRSAPAITGPWSGSTHLFTAAQTGGGWTYDTYVHQEYTPADGSALYVTYTRSNGVGWFGSETVLERVTLAPR